VYGLSRAALVSPRVRGVVLAPSWTATERVLWLAAVDRCLTSTAADSTEVRRAYGHLRRLIDRAAPSLYAQAPIDAARESRWIVDVRAALPPGTPAERAATVLWAACGAWTDAPSGRWGLLADLASDLADALDGVAGCARATALRAQVGA
jgi:hypothetical protein